MPRISIPGMMSKRAGFRAALAAMVISAGCARVEGPSVVLIVIDTLRADHVGVLGAGENRTPVLDRLAGEGVLFEECFSQYPLTLPSFATLLASQWPNAHRVRENYDERLSDRAFTLAEALKARGYRTAAFVSALPVRAETGCSQGFDVYDDDFSQRFEFFRPEFEPLEESWTGSERRGDATIERAIAWAAKAKRPYFLFVHLFDPHSPYDPPEPFASRQRTPYAGEVEFSDALVGRLLETIGKRGGEPPLVSIVSDHGEGLGEHEEWAHGLFVYDTTIHVPWILWWPGRLTSARVRAQVRLLDVAPTIVEALGHDLPPQWQGAGCLGLARGEPEPQREIFTENYYTRVEYGWSELQAWITPEWKWIRAPRPELYDRRTDPHETTNVIERHPEIAGELEKALHAFAERSIARARAFGLDGLSEAIQPEARVKEWLTNLGYVDGGGEPREGPLPDPKDQVPDWNRSNASRTHAARGESFLAAGDLPLALSAFRAAVEEKPTAEALSGLGATLVRLGRHGDARTELARALDLAPNDVRTLSAYAGALQALGEPAAADSVLFRATLVDSSRAEIWRQRAGLCNMLGRRADAMTFFERSLALEPENEDAIEALAGLYATGGKHARAVPLYRRLAERRAWDPILLWQLALAEAASGDHEAAVRDLQAARPRAGPGVVRDSIDAALRRLDR